MKQLMNDLSIIGSIAPVSATGAVSGDYASLKNALKCAVLVMTGVVDTSITVRLRQAQDVSGTGVKALNFSAVNRQGGYLSMESLTANFTVGETVTGETSSATGVVYRNDSSKVFVHSISGTFEAAETITGGTSSATATTTSVLTAAGMKMRVEVAAANTIALTVSGESLEIEVEPDTLDVENGFDCIVADVSAEAGSGSLIGISYLVRERYIEDPKLSLLID